MEQLEPPDPWLLETPLELFIGPINEPDLPEPDDICKHPSDSLKFIEYIEYYLIRELHCKACGIQLWTLRLDEDYYEDV